MLRRIFAKNQIEIVQIKKVEKDKSCWGGEGIIFFLKMAKVY